MRRSAAPASIRYSRKAGLSLPGRAGTGRITHSLLLPRCLNLPLACGALVGCGWPPSLRSRISIEGEVVISVLRGISEGARSLPEIALIVTAETAGGA